MGDKDELVKGIDSAGLSEVEKDRREALFHRRVKKQLAMMLSPDRFKARERAAAARLLGEYGEPTTIPHLIKTYRSDQDKAVRQAAGEALAMLKRLGQSITSPDPEESQLAVQMVENIVLYNQLGRPARVSPGVLRSFSLVLIVIALAVFGVAALGPALQPEDPSLIPLDVQLTRTAVVVAARATGTAAHTTPSPTPTSDNPQVLLGQFIDFYATLDAEARLLQAQMLTITRQQPQDCTLAFAPTAQYTPPGILQGLANFDQAVAGVNSAEAIIAQVRAAFQDSCRIQQAIPRQEALALSERLITAQRTLTDLRPILQGYDGVTVPPTATAIAVPTNTAEPTPEPSPTPTLDTSDARNQILAMTDTISDMTGPRGLATLLLSYWQNTAAGSANDCLQMPPPLIPGAITVGPGALAVAPELAEIASSVNTALANVRASYAAFDTGCNTNQLGALFRGQIPVVQAAIITLTDAQARLNAVQQRLR